MKILTAPITVDELRPMAAKMFDNMIKAVVDVRRKVMAVDAEVHADLEARLLEDGSSQYDLWGVNLYPENAGEGFIEFDSMINIRPAQGNRSRGVDAEETRQHVVDVVQQLVRR